MANYEKKPWTDKGKPGPKPKVEIQDKTKADIIKDLIAGVKIIEIQQKYKSEYGITNHSTLRVINDFRAGYLDDVVEEYLKK